MHLNNAALAKHSQMAELMNSLNALQTKMQKVHGIFPNYYQHLLQRYNQMLQVARKSNMTPPWLGA